MKKFKDFLQRNNDFGNSGARCEGEANLLIDQSFTNCKDSFSPPETECTTDGTMDNCIFCDKLLENGEQTVKLGKKGCDNINKISSDRQQEILTVPGLTVHHDCRRDFINLKSTRWKTSVDVDTEISTPERGTLEFQSSVESSCRERNDKWGEEVLSRIQMAHSDLHAADAVYHAQCNSNFRTSKQMPQTIAKTPEDNLKKRKISYAGRPKNDIAENGFQAIMLRIEKNQKQISIAELVREMEQLCGLDNTYSVVHMKKKIQDYFGKSIMFTEEEGKPSVLTFRDNISPILHNFYNRIGKENKEEEKKIYYINCSTAS
ncbi:Hypothetical predicted protein [Mytilus galloprovincialis]|nr:Hypothetical predicted protein [Mytilus galloprovincialis]